jgi:HD domain
MRVTIDPPLLRSLLVLASVIEARDPFTGGHVWRTSRYARTLAQRLGMERGDVFLAQLGGLVHDLGKIGVPDALLAKRGPFTAAEMGVMRLHPEIGEALVVNHPLAALVQPAVLEHHLRPDGTGYPVRLAARGPSDVARVVAIADAFDAVTSFRPYREGDRVERAVEVLEAGRGTQFDAAFADAFVALARSGSLDHVLGHASEGMLMLTCPECGPIIAPPRAAREGDEIDCPACTGRLVLHFAGESFEVEWKGIKSGARVARPDADAVDDVLRDAPPAVDAPGE